ncbi:hypothetical protein V6N11_044986 [Hibiscus sabdariffa]|uniref:RNase H type-1 domain-containing protein n=1 Tax=Hibiscus sabdariffa TaxID=183260 RepID=A0ABR2PUF4_9ROSI
MFQDPSSLMSRVRAAIYFRNKLIFEAILGSRPSFAMNLCTFCQQFEETVVYALRDCITIQTILQQFGLHGRVRLDYSQDCLGWVTSAHSILDVTCMFMVNRFPQHGYWVLGMNTRHLQKECTTGAVEAFPCYEAILLSSDKGWHRVLIEGDAANVINYMQASSDDTSMLAQTLSEAKLMLKCLSFLPT